MRSMGSEAQEPTDRSSNSCMIVIRPQQSDKRRRTYTDLRKGQLPVAVGAFLSRRSSHRMKGHIEAQWASPEHLIGSARNDDGSWFLIEHQISRIGFQRLNQ